MQEGHFRILERKPIWLRFHPDARINYQSRRGEGWKLWSRDDNLIIVTIPCPGDWASGRLQDMVDEYVVIETHAGYYFRQDQEHADIMMMNSLLT